MSSDSTLEGEHPFFHAEAIADSLQTELEIIAATTNAEEQLAAKNTEVRCAATSAAFKQMQVYRRNRKEILRKLIKEKKEYIQLLQNRIAEIDAYLEK